MSTTKSKSPALKPLCAPHALPAGEYWITDPCYVYPDARWMDFCDSLDVTPCIFQYGRTKFYVWSTAYGDGVYPVAGKAKGECFVDAGLLAIVPVSLVKKWKKRDDAQLAKLAVRVKITKPFTISESGGDVKFAGITVKTTGIEEYDDN